MKQDRGFVLVNALVLVTAMAAVAVFLLARAEAGRVRLEQRQGADQITYYLDGFDALAVTLLNRDGRSGESVDHLNEAWAKPDYAVPVDRGQIAGQISDLQGRFNLNWLADASNTRARAAFDPLMARIGVSPQSAQAILAFVKSGGPDARQAYLQLDPPLDPVGGAMLMIEQLRDIPQLSDQDRARIGAVSAVLPGDSALNINTAPSAVLHSFVPELSLSVLEKILAPRARTPFTSVDTFIARLEATLGEELDESFDAARFSVGSNWFGVTATATLGPHTARRRSVLHRKAFPIGTSVRWQTTSRP